MEDGETFHSLYRLTFTAGCNGVQPAVSQYKYDKQTGDCREKFFSSLQEILNGTDPGGGQEWVVEISTYCVTIAGFLGMAVTFVANKHIKVDILLSHLSKRTNEILSVLTSFIGMIFCGVVTIYAIGMVAMSLEHGMIAPTTLRTPLWIPQSSLPIGFGLMFLHFIRTFLENLVKLGDPDYDPAAAAGEVAK